MTDVGNVFGDVDSGFGDIFTSFGDFDQGFSNFDIGFIEVENGFADVDTMVLCCRLHNNLPDETQLPNGQKFELLSLALLGVPSMAEKFMEVSSHLEIKRSIFLSCHRCALRSTFYKQ